MSKSEREEILHEIEALPQEQRKLVLDVARALAGRGESRHAEKPFFDSPARYRRAISSAWRR